MAQTMQTPAEARDERLALAARNDRLQALVGELVQTNEELRLKLALIEAKAERTARALGEASAIYGLLVP